MFSSRQPSQPAGPPGYRAYAVGDVHGRLDLLDALLEEIHRDIDRRGAKDVVLVFLGDLIDRGPDSKGVVERLRTYRRDGVRAVFLLGNHEEVLLRILEGDAALVAQWRRFGGSECLESYGVDPDQLAHLGADAELAIVREAIPAAHVEFLKSFVDTFRFGDYLFVHAGVRPGVPLHEQQQSDLRWIREPFLLDDSDHGFVVVHGHTISRRIDERTNRIGIDTGACATGILSAVAIDGEERWFMDTSAFAPTAVSPTH